MQNEDSGFWKHKAKSTWQNGIKRQTGLVICQNDNLIGGKINGLLKVNIILPK